MGNQELIYRLRETETALTGRFSLNEEDGLMFIYDNPDNLFASSDEILQGLAKLRILDEQIARFIQ